MKSWNNILLNCLPPSLSSSLPTPSLHPPDVVLNSTFAISYTVIIAFTSAIAINTDARFRVEGSLHRFYGFITTFNYPASLNFPTQQTQSVGSIILILTIEFGIPTQSSIPRTLRPTPSVSFNPFYEASFTSSSLWLWVVVVDGCRISIVVDLIPTYETSLLFFHIFFSSVIRRNRRLTFTSLYTTGNWCYVP